MTKKHEDTPTPAESEPVPGGRDILKDAPDVTVAPKDTPPVSE